MFRSFMKKNMQQQLGVSFRGINDDISLAQPIFPLF